MMNKVEKKIASAHVRYMDFPHSWSSFYCSSLSACMSALYGTTWVSKYIQSLIYTVE